MTSTIDPQEIEKFSKIADEWWDPEGKFKPLHKFNPIRIEFIRRQILQHFNIESLNNLNILDIGCGGGLISEPFAKMGANITAIDAAKKNIEIAKIHAQKSNLKINYQTDCAENLATTKEQFDVVLALEIIEHVSDVDSFIKNCAQLVKKDGIIFFSTMNRTLKSLALAKIGAEYILRWLPIGTHDWNKFLKPSTINNSAQQNDLTLQHLMGFSYNLINDSWKESQDLSVNYAAVFVKNI